MPLEEYRRRVAEQKRTALVLAARSCFARHGFERASLEAIAAEAKVSSATLYKHFPTKAELFVAAMGELRVDGAPPDVAENTPTEEGLTLILDAYASLLARPGSADLFRSVLAEASRQPELAAGAEASGKQPFVDALEELLDGASRRGEITVPEPGLAIELLLGMVKAVVFWPALITPGYAVTTEERVRAVEEARSWFLARHARRPTGGGPAD